MSPEERQLLVGLFDRIKAAGDGPRDREAEAFIADAVKSAPYAPYLLAQTTIVQDQALRAANDRLQQLEAEVRELSQQASQAQQAQQSGGFLSGLGSLFGGGAPQPQRNEPPQQSWGGRREPQPQGGWGGQPQQPYGQQFQGAGPNAGPWGQQQGGFGGPMGGPMGGGMMGGGMMGGGGGGFLKGALGAAAGVAGGVLLADSIKGLFAGGHANPLGIGEGVAGADPKAAADTASADAGGGDTTINNYYGEQPSQQADAGQDPGYQNADFGGDYDYGSDDTSDI